MEKGDDAVQSREKGVEKMGAEPQRKKHKSTDHIRDSSFVVGDPSRSYTGDTTGAPQPLSPSPSPSERTEKDLNTSVVDEGKSGHIHTGDTTPPPCPSPSRLGLPLPPTVAERPLVFEGNIFEDAANLKSYPFPKPELKQEVPGIGVITPELRQWVDDYNEWKGLNYFKDPFPTYTGPPPPIPRTWDPEVRAKIKCADKRLERFKATVEKAVKFYNKQHPCADLEAVEILRGSFFYRGGKGKAITFTAKPKTAAADDDGCLLTIDAESFYGQPTGDPVFDMFNPGDFTYCTAVEGRDIEFYQGCPFYCGADHPPETFLPYVSLPAYLQGRYHSQDGAFPLQACSSAVRLAASLAAKRE